MFQYYLKIIVGMYQYCFHHVKFSTTGFKNQQDNNLI